MQQGGIYLKETRNLADPEGDAESLPQFVQNLPFSLTPFRSCRQFVFSLNMTWPAAVFLLNRKRLL
jgi:hypothetical protein